MVSAEQLYRERLLAERRRLVERCDHLTERIDRRWWRRGVLSVREERRYSEWADGIRAIDDHLGWLNRHNP